MKNKLSSYINDSERSKALLYPMLFIVFLLLYFLVDFHFLRHVDALFMSRVKYSIFQEYVRNFSFPLINTYEGGGIPLYSMGSADLLFLWLLKFLSVVDFQAVMAIVYVCIILFVQYVFLKKLKYSENAAVLGSFIYGFNAFILCYANEHMFTIACLAIPLSLFLIINYYENPGEMVKWGTLLALVTAIVMMTGRLALIEYSYCVYFIWILMFHTDFRGKTVGENLRSVAGSLVFLGGALVCALLLTSVFMLPYFETIFGTYRSGTITPPKYVDWLALLVGHIFPNITPDMGGKFYTPMVIMPFVAMGLAKIGRIQIFSLFLMSLYVFLSYPFHLFELIQKLPLQSGNIVTMRFVNFFFLGCSILAAVGYDRYFRNSMDLSAERAGKIIKSVTAAVVLMAFVIIVASIFFSKIELLNSFLFNGSGDFYSNIRSNKHIGTLKKIITAALLIFAVLSVFLIKILKRSRGKIIFFVSLIFYFLAIIVIGMARNGIDTLLFKHYASLFLFIVFAIALYKRYLISSAGNNYALLFCVVYMIAFGHLHISYKNKGDEEHVFKAALSSGVMRRIQELSLVEKEPFRVINSRMVFRKTIYPYLGVDTFQYYAPMPPMNLYRYYTDIIGERTGASPYKTVVLSPFYALANVKYVIVTNDYYEKYLADRQGYSPVYSDDEYRIVKDENWFHRFRLVDKHIVVARDDEAIAYLKSKETDMDFFRTSVVLDREIDMTSDAGMSEGEKIDILEDKYGRIKLSVETERDSIMVAAYRYDKGWKASIDGISTEVMKANYLFTGIKVPSGKHLVEMRYTSKVLGYGMAISIVTAIVLFFMNMSWILPRGAKSVSA